MTSHTFSFSDLDRAFEIMERKRGPGADSVSWPRNAMTESPAVTPSADISAGVATAAETEQWPPAASAA
jgi:hypothetical protein